MVAWRVDLWMISNTLAMVGKNDISELNRDVSLTLSKLRRSSATLVWHGPMGGHNLSSALLENSYFTNEKNSQNQHLSVQVQHW